MWFPVIDTLLFLCYYFLGSVAAGDTKKGKKGSRGKSGRMTEAEEDEQLLKSAQSKRRVVRVDKQPSSLSPHCKMHGYQLEGLNWLIKLHCNGINGILADEVSTRNDSVSRYLLAAKGLTQNTMLTQISFLLEPFNSDGTR
jgi:hypothetical protein